MQLSFGDDPDLEKKLANIRRRYFTTTNEEKKIKLREDFEKLVTSDPSLFAESKRNSQLKSFRPLASNNQAKFFDLTTMFGISGFPIIIGNPPYKVLEGSDSTEILENLRSITSYKYALGGKLNLYRHFIERAVHLLSENGILSFIVPSTLIADKNTQGIRKMFKEKGSLKFLIEFPEKEKVFESVTQATTVFLFENGKSSNVFSLSVGLNSAVLPPDSHADIHWDEVQSLFGDALVFPLIKSNYELDLIKVIHKDSKNLKKLVSCYQGDINVSSRKSDLRNVKTDFLLVRGEHVQAYGVNLSDSDPDRRWIEINKSELKGTLEPVTRERLVMQGISNMGTKFRLQVGKIPAGVVVGHSANVLEIINDEIDVNSTLAILNSKLMNWYYKKISTNNNVNIYELDDLPIRVFEGEKLKKIDSLVNRVLEIKTTKNPTSKLNEEIETLQSQIDILVYELYEIESNNINIIENTF
jgi:Alw26I/Eco31I/Esp3I family type II restriction m6 adenine DNA methyltransferase